MNTTKTWTEADTVTLDRMMKEGCSNKMIAKMLGRSESYISQKKKDLGFPLTKPKRWSYEEEEQVRKLYFKGYSDEEIGEKLNRSMDSIRVHRTYLGLNDFNEIDWDKEFLQVYFINQLKSCRSMDEAVYKTGIKDFAIKNRLKDYVKKNILSEEIYNELRNKFKRRVVRL